MKKQVVLFGAVLTLISLIRSTGLAALPPDNKPLPNYDGRTAVADARGASTSDQRAAVEKLRSRVPQARVDFDTLTGAPKSVAASDGFLTGPAGEGRAVSAASLAGLPANDPYRATRAFLK